MNNNDWRSKRTVNYDGHNRKAGANARQQDRRARRRRRIWNQFLSNWVRLLRIDMG